MVSISGDQIMISIVGVTVASFPQLASTDPNAPNIEIKADFLFIGQLAPAIPEPTSALLFAAGIATVGLTGRRAAQKY